MNDVNLSLGIEVFVMYLRVYRQIKKSTSVGFAKYSNHWHKYSRCEKK